MADRKLPEVTPLRFLFVGFCRDWNPLKGQTPPKGRVCELRSLPGNVVVWASTFDEAFHKLRVGLERAFASRPSAVEWYEESLSAMTPDEEAERQALWERAWKERRPVKELPMEGTFGVVTEHHMPWVEYVSFVLDEPRRNEHAVVGACAD